MDEGKPLPVGDFGVVDATGVLPTGVFTPATGVLTPATGVLAPATGVLAPPVAAAALPTTAAAAAAVLPTARGLHSSTSQLNVSTLCRIRCVPSFGRWVIIRHELVTKWLTDQNGLG